MEETEVRDHSKAIKFVPNSSPAVEQIELSIYFTTKPSTKKNKVKKWFSSSKDDNTTTYCCCNILATVAKCLELSGLITGVVIVLMLFSIPIISHYDLVSE